MRYQHNADDGDYPRWIGAEGWFKSEVDPETGEFDVPDDHEKLDAIKARLDELGHEPVDGETEADRDPLADLTEDDVAAMEPQEIRSFASDHPDLDGRKGADELEEKIILRLREDE